MKRSIIEKFTAWYSSVSNSIVSKMIKFQMSEAHLIHLKFQSYEL